MLSNLLKPRQVHRSIYDINLKSLWDKGYRYIIIDVDNTLTAWNNYNISQRLLDWILLAKRQALVYACFPIVVSQKYKNLHQNWVSFHPLPEASPLSVLLAML